MFFHVGPVPVCEFDTHAEGWRSMREPGVWALQAVATPVALLVGWGMLMCFQEAGSLPARLMSLNADVFLVAALSLILLIPIHELIHALATPDFGRTGMTVVGAWPERLLFYAFYLGELTRERFLAVMVMPFVVLSLLPMMLAAITGLPRDLAVAAVVNGMLSSGDLVGTALVAAQVPSRAAMRNKGWRSYWRSNQGRD